MQIIINAGGTGTRLWPYSTDNKPKQFIPLIDEESFLAKTYNRLISKFGSENIWINTNHRFKNYITDLIPEFDPDRILTEPEKRDSFAAIVSHAALVAKRTSKDEPLIFVHSDHLIFEKDWVKFNSALEILENSIKSNDFDLVTAAVKPTFANTKLGYIEIEIENIEKCFLEVVNVNQFKEKPSKDLAEEFLNSGNFLWNLGYFGFTFENILNSVKSFHSLEVLSAFQNIYEKNEITTEDYQKIPKMAFDYAIAEKTDKLGVVGIDIDWEDIGSWESAKKYIPELGVNKNFIEFSGQNNKVKLLNSEKRVAFVGLSDVLVVESDEGLLVINTEKSSDVKKVAEYFKDLDKD